MSAWQGLLKKEFRLGRTWLFTGLILIMAGSIGNYFFNGGLRVELAAFGIFMIALHFPYLGVYMFSSLNRESDKLHLWLQNPQPARNLLLAKFLNGLLSMLISLTVVSLITAVVAKSTISTSPLEWSYIWEFGIFILLNLTAASIYIGIWVVLAWTVFRVLKTIMGRWAWLGLSIVLTVSMGILEIFSGTKVYYLLTNWGSIELASLQRLQQLVSAFPEMTVQSTEPNITIGFYVFHSVIVLLIFLLSSWLLDKKVEV